MSHRSGWRRTCLWSAFLVIVTVVVGYALIARVKASEDTFLSLDRSFLTLVGCGWCVAAILGAYFLPKSPRMMSGVYLIVLSVCIVGVVFPAGYWGTHNWLHYKFPQKLGLVPGEASLAKNPGIRSLRFDFEPDFTGDDDKALASLRSGPVSQIHDFFNQKLAQKEPAEPSNDEPTELAPGSSTIDPLVLAVLKHDLSYFPLALQIRISPAEHISKTGYVLKDASRRDEFLATLEAVKQSATQIPLEFARTAAIEYAGSIEAPESSGSITMRKRLVRDGHPDFVNEVTVLKTPLERVAEKYFVGSEFGSSLRLFRNEGEFYEKDYAGESLAITKTFLALEDAAELRVLFDIVLKSLKPDFAAENPPDADTTAEVRRSKAQLEFLDHVLQNHVVALARSADDFKSAPVRNALQEFFGKIETWRTEKVQMTATVGTPGGNGNPNGGTVTVPIILPPAENLKPETPKWDRFVAIEDAAKALGMQIVKETNEKDEFVNYFLETDHTKIKPENRPPKTWQYPVFVTVDQEAINTCDYTFDQPAFEKLYRKGKANDDELKRYWFFNQVMIAWKVAVGIEKDSDPTSKPLIPSSFTQAMAAERLVAISLPLIFHSLRQEQQYFSPHITTAYQYKDSHLKDRDAKERLLVLYGCKMYSKADELIDLETRLNSIKELQLDLGSRQFDGSPLELVDTSYALKSRAQLISTPPPPSPQGNTSNTYRPPMPTKLYRPAATRQENHIKRYMYFCERIYELVTSDAEADELNGQFSFKNTRYKKWFKEAVTWYEIYSGPGPGDPWLFAVLENASASIGNPELNKATVQSAATGKPLRVTGINELATDKEKIEDMNAIAQGLADLSPDGLTLDEYSRLFRGVNFDDPKRSHTTVWAELFPEDYAPSLK